MRTLFTRLAILPKGEGEDSNNTMDELINHCWNWVEKAYPSIDINKNKILPIKYINLSYQFYLLNISAIY